MKSRKFITGFFLLMMIVSGFLSRSVYADQGKVKFTITLEEGQTIEGDLVLDLYRIADIVWDGTGEKDTSGKKQTSYYLETAADSDFKSFNGVNVGVDKDTLKLRDETVDLDSLANSAAKIIFGGSEKTITSVQEAALNTEYTLDSGLYLAVAHSGDLDEDDYKDYIESEGDNYTSFAYSYDKKYSFKPLLVFVYGDNAAAVDLSKKDADGLLIKYSLDDRYGELDIIKTVSVYGGEKTDTTLIFSVKGFKNEGDEDPVYEKLITIDLDHGGEYDPIVIDDIPVGLYVVVTEEYPGASYVLITDKEVKTQITPIDKGPQVARFTNEYKNIPYSGYGVTNTFTYSETEGKGEWDWCNDADVPCAVSVEGE